MKRKIYIDTDIFLDVALARKEFVDNSKLVLTLAENYFFFGFTSSVIINNIYYIARKSSNDETSRKFISDLMKYISILAVDQNDIENALKSKIKDFEDAIQFSVSNKNHCEIIVTRNIDDYKLSDIPVMLPLDLIKIYKEKL